MRVVSGGATWMFVTTVVMAGLIPARPAAAQEEAGAKILIGDLPIAEQVRLTEEAEARETESTDLFRRARQAEQAGDWGEAGSLYGRAAELRVDGDLMGATGYELSGRAHFFDGRPGRASRAWEEAGNRALILGDVIGAARNFMYAAVAAQEKGQETRAVELGWKAYHLTHSEALTSRERAMIRQHLEVTTGS